MIGRTLAMCVHPEATWRSQSAASRWLVVLTYAVMGYVIVLAMLSL